MDRYIIYFLLLLFLVAGFKPAVKAPQAEENFCELLKNLLEAADSGFASAKGEPTERIITGITRKFYISKIKFNDEHECYINDVDAYPECECILATDSRITEKLIADYESFKNQIKECLPSGWKIAEQDSTNNFYLKGTEYRKLVLRENVEGKKVKFHLYMYSSMIEKKRIVELKIEGLAKEK